MRVARFALLALALWVSARVLLAGGEHSGQVTFGGLPVPGATVTATSGDKKLVTATDDQGLFNLPDATEGVWSLHVEMLGFEPLTRDITVTTTPQPSEWTLMLRPFDDITRGIPRPAPAPPAAATNGGAAASSRGAAPAPVQGRGFQRAGVTTSPSAPARGDRPPASVEAPPAEPANGSADGFLINGSVNNGAASPFAQAAAFGNNRRGRGSLFNYQFALVEGNSSLDAKPFALAGQPTISPAYNDFHVGGTFGGPLRFSKFMRNGPNVFIGFQHAGDTNATTTFGVMPTALERAGDFSQSHDPLGRSLQIINPSNGQPFTGGVIPGSRISPQATALLGLYPLPNFTGTGLNYQTPLTTFTRQDLFTSRAAQSINNRNQLIGLFAYQHSTTDQTTLFGFEDSSAISGVDTSLTWTHRINQFITMRPRAQYTELTNQTTPYFANRTNVSGLAGITGNNQDPANWGPPSLGFASITPLSDATPNFTRTRTYGGGMEVYWSHGRHNFTMGGDVRRLAIDIQSQQNPRGSFTFTGALTGSDFADFLLGVPTGSAIAFGNADKNLRGYSSDAYITDDWRFSPTLTMQIGARWEYDTPMTESQGRLVNLDITPGFTAATPVVGSLLKSDPRGLQPRLGLAWRPVPGSSLVIRAGYGIYRNQNVYQSIVTQLAQQPPFSKAYTIPNSAAFPLTLASGFPALPAALTTNTFAVDPNLRIGAAQNWQALIQRDLPGSLTIVATYLGTKGTDLLQESLPNTYAPGAVNPCPSCPSGFVFLQSNGSSSRHAGQFQLRRRLRNGLMASIQYTLAKATDDATAFAGVSLAGSAIAQDWRNLDAETAPSNFDQRHQINATFQYTTGMGVGGGALIDGLKGKLYKGWTVTGNLIVGSGTPFTPVLQNLVAGSGVVGQLRPNLVSGVSTAAPSGSYLNPAAYEAPPAGQFGDVGRNSVVGPMQFTFNAGITRTFQMTERLSADWRIDATNLLNRLTYTGVNAIFGGSQFGLPINANTPRKIQTTFRMRF
jgi:hypothetical protein